MRLRRMSAALHVGLAFAVAGLAGCATAPKSGAEAAAEAEDNNDPFEAVNRKMWAFDMGLDRFFLKPIALGYRDYTPDIAQTAVHNVLTNLKSPAVLLNDILQGNPEHATQTLARITVNTTIGIGGLVDVAGKHGIPAHEADFGQTLGAWGVGPGPYLVLPLLGPSDPRDGLGYGFDSLADPFSIKMHAAGLDDPTEIRAGLGVVSDRAATIDQLDELKKESLDFYAAIRSLYQQQRAAAVATARHENLAPIPDLPADSSPAAPAPNGDKAK